MPRNLKFSTISLFSNHSLMLYQNSWVVKALDLRANGFISSWVRTPLLVQWVLLFQPEARWRFNLKVCSRPGKCSNNFRIYCLESWKVHVRVKRCHLEKAAGGAVCSKNVRFFKQSLFKMMLRAKDRSKRRGCGNAKTKQINTQKITWTAANIQGPYQQAYRVE